MPSDADIALTEKVQRRLALLKALGTSRRGRRHSIEGPHIDPSLGSPEYGSYATRLMLHWLEAVIAAVVRVREHAPHTDDDPPAGEVDFTEAPEPQSAYSIAIVTSPIVPAAPPRLLACT